MLKLAFCRFIRFSVPLSELDEIVLALDYIKPRCRAQIEAS